MMKNNINNITVKELIKALEEFSTSPNQEVILSNRSSFKHLIDGFGETVDGQFVIDFMKDIGMVKYK